MFLMEASRTSVAGSVGDGFVVLIQPFGRRLVVVRRHREQPVRAGLLHFCGRMNHFTRVIPTGTREHQRSSAGHLHADLDDATALVGGERGCLSGRAARHQKMDARIHLAPGEATNGGFVKRTGLGKGSDEGRSDACEFVTHKSLWMKSLPLSPQ
jgi:hypothetical protein